MKKILIIEDDQEIQNVLGILLKGNGFDVVRAYSGTEGLLVDISDVDLILLDLMLPGRSGQEIIGDLKAKKDIPVIIMSAVNDISAKVDLFALGADDYVTKPFNINEIKARMDAILRRTEKGRDKKNDQKDQVLEISDMRLELNNKRLFISGKEVNVTVKEFEVLELLAGNPGKVYSREKLLELIWGLDYPGGSRTVDVHVRRLREKIEPEPGEPKYVQTKWGVGYYFHG